MRRLLRLRPSQLSSAQKVRLWHSPAERRYPRISRRSEVNRTHRRLRKIDANDPFETFSRTLLDCEAAKVIDARWDSKAEYLEFRPQLGPIGTLREKSAEMPCGAL